MIEKLVLSKEYSRQEVHDHLDPYTPFISGTGTWGLHGIIRISKEENFVFFVTIGQEQNGYSFNEGISRQGILTWQSQPKQKLEDKLILEFINHNHLLNNIHLFFRENKINRVTKKAEPYKYYGKLAYESHDPNHEQPVHFKWRLLDWKKIKKMV